MTMRGLSAAYWLLKTNPWMKAGDSDPFHAAAGAWAYCFAVGEAAWASGHRHSVDRGEGRVAKAHGCDEIIFYRRENVVEPNSVN